MKTQVSKGLILHNASLKKKRIQKSLKFALIKDVKQFCLSTCMHGYRFIILPNRKPIERVFWALVCFTSLAIALALIGTLHSHSKEDPLILVTDSAQYPIWNYDFPSITICENNKISKKRAYHVAKTILQTNDSDEIEKLQTELRNMYYLVINNITNENIIDNLTYLQNIFDEHNYQAHTVLRWLTKSCDDIIIKCLWKGLSRKCSYLFQQIRTTDGFCCSFNYFAFRNFTPTVGALTHRISDKPVKTSTCGYRNGLVLLLDSDREDYFASYVPSIGFRIKIQNPYLFSDWNSRNAFNTPQTLSLISINPQATYSSDDVRMIPIENRQCLFHDERNLLYFSHYSFHNCLVELRLNITRELCNCTPYYYLDGTINEPNFQICNLLDVPCLGKIDAQLRSSFPHPNISTSSDVSHNLTRRYNCYRDCDSIFYSHRTSNSRLNKTNAAYVPYLFGGVILKDHSVLRIFFNDLVGVKNRRHVRFTPDTLLAFFGGLLGFLLGFSFVSGIDLVYFIIIRLISYATPKRQSPNVQIQQSKHITPRTKLVNKFVVPYCIKNRNEPILPFIN